MNNGEIVQIIGNEVTNYGWAIRKEADAEGADDELEALEPMVLPAGTVLASIASGKDLVTTKQPSGVRQIGKYNEVTGMVPVLLSGNDMPLYAYPSTLRMDV